MKKVYLFLLISLLFGCSSVKKIENQINLDYTQEDVAKNEIETIRKLKSSEPTKALWRSYLLDNKDIFQECIDHCLIQLDLSIEEKDYFEDAIKNDEFLEYAQFVGNYYGTPKKKIDEILESGRNVLLEIEVQGAKQVMAKRPDAITIFMIPPSFEELEKRIRGRRSEPEDIVAQRLSKAKGEMELKNNYKYVVVNDTVENASLAIIDIINSVKDKQD